MLVFTEKDFTQIDNTRLGSHGGYIVENKDGGSKFLLKNGSTQEIITEYIMGGVYKCLLKDSCPETILVKNEKEHKFMIGSSWKENAKNLYEMIKEKSSQNFEGIEEIVMSGLL